MLSIKAGEADMGLAVGVEQMGKMGLLGGAGSKKEAKVFAPSGRYGAVTGTDGYIGTAGMPGVFAQAGMGYAYENDGVGFELGLFYSAFPVDEVIAQEDDESGR